MRTIEVLVGNNSFTAAFSSQEGGLFGLPLRASHREVKAKVEIEGREDAGSDRSVLNLSLNLNLPL